MKHTYSIQKLTFYIFIAILALAQSCSKDAVVGDKLELSTSNADSITDTSAYVACTLSNSEEAIFTDKGFCWDSLYNPSIQSSKTSEGKDVRNFSNTIKGLKPNTKYYVKAYAVNGDKVWYGNIVSFTTKESAGTIHYPKLTISSEILHNSFVVLAANVTGDSIYTITERGVCWSKTPNPTVNSYKQVQGFGYGAFENIVNGLTPNTLYYFRAYAVNSFGVFYSGDIQLRTIKQPVYGTVSDIIGNSYTTVEIGNQVWMAQNLRTTKYSDGSDITYVKDSAQWKTLKTEAYSSFNNYFNTDFVEKNGFLYNKYAATSTKKICPQGWHVPTTAEWDTLKNYLINNSYGYYGYNTSNKIAKTLASTTDWLPSYTEGYIGDHPEWNNSSGFNAYPSGYRYNDGVFHYLYNGSCWWTATPANYVYLNFLNTTFESGSAANTLGFSIRCLKD